MLYEITKDTICLFVCWFPDTLGIMDPLVCRDPCPGPVGFGSGMAAFHWGAGMGPRPGGTGFGGLPVPNLWSGRGDSVHDGDLSAALGHWGCAAGGSLPQPLSAVHNVAGCRL